MAQSTHWTLRGVPEMHAKFGKLDAAMKGQGARLAMRAGGMVIMNGAKRRAPYRTGTLRRSIAIEDGPGPLEVTIGTDLNYAPYVEFGTSRMAARPYLRPALDEDHDEAMSAIGDALDDLLAAVGAS